MNNDEKGEKFQKNNDQKPQFEKNTVNYHLFEPYPHSSSFFVNIAGFVFSELNAR